MTALPITLETALRHQGFTIDVAEHDTITIALDNGGTIRVPAMPLAALTWRRETPVEPEFGADLYLGTFPIFDAAYRPVLLSHILDRYRTRRLGYDTPGQWMLAFRRWCNLNMPLFDLRYVSTGITLPLDDRDALDHTEATTHGLDTGSDFPQSLVSGSTDYLTAATDRKSADNADVRRTGRMASVMSLLAEQRNAYLNVDAEVLTGLDSLFLTALDAGEGTRGANFGGPYGSPYSPSFWPGW